MRLPRPKSVGNFWTGVAYAVIGAIGLVVGHADGEVPYVFLALGALNVAVSFVFARPAPSARADGPDPLRPTPARRFRTTGWPPSKDPDDYR